jgi:hypothetical protein
MSGWPRRANERRNETPVVYLLCCTISFLTRLATTILGFGLPVPEGAARYQAIGKPGVQSLADSALSHCSTGVWNAEFRGCATAGDCGVPVTAGGV